MPECLLTSLERVMPHALGNGVRSHHCQFVFFVVVKDKKMLTFSPTAVAYHREFSKRETRPSPREHPLVVHASYGISHDLQISCCQVSTKNFAVGQTQAEPHSLVRAVC